MFLDDVYNLRTKYYEHYETEIDQKLEHFKIL